LYSVLLFIPKAFVFVFLLCFVFLMFLFFLHFSVFCMFVFFCIFVFFGIFAFLYFCVFCICFSYWFTDHNKYKTPVLGNTIPVLGVKPNWGG